MQIGPVIGLILGLIKVMNGLGNQGSLNFCNSPGDNKSRQKYCQSADPEDIERCLSCFVGPSCPVPVPVKTGRPFEDGLLLLRGIKERKIQKLIVAMLNKQRLNQQWSKCVPLYSWDADLASAAQAWADQCALVEYKFNQSVASNQNDLELHHDSWIQRSAVLEATEAGFHNEPGVAQTVHWARTTGFDLNGEILEALIESDVQIEDGLVDGLMTNLPEHNEAISSKSGENDEKLVVFGQATHVGCGWIQFPASKSEDGQPQKYENFMVCNYGVGKISKTTCDKMKTGDEEQKTMIKYYTVTSEIIKDVKACLEAVRCRRRRRKFLKTFASDVIDQNDPCGQDVKTCLSGQSGLKFVDATNLRSVARSSEFRSIDVEATKCKIDTILCSLNSTFTCRERLEYCLPLIDFEGHDKGQGQPLCECADLTLSDGTRGDCSEKLLNKNTGREDYFCFVKQSPCVSIDLGGRLEMSKPYLEAVSGLLHYTHLLC